MSAVSAPAASTCRDHVVSFYESDAELFDLIGPRLVRAVGADGTVIVIATPEHRVGLLTAMRAWGARCEHAEREGRLHLLDAAETLSKFVSDGRIDVTAFHAVIGGLLATQAGPVTVYGEMVALLWDSGAVVEAMQLESLWNRLAEDAPFSLFCAYPARIAGDLEHAEAFQRVCGLHDSVLEAARPLGRASADPTAEPGRAIESQRDFAPTLDSICLARRFLVDALRGWPLPPVARANAALVVSELATNAIVHADSPFWVHVRRTVGGVRITVGDTGSSDTVLIIQRAHGLGIVSTLATCWGMRATDEGKAVWVELSIG